MQTVEAVSIDREHLIYSIRSLPDRAIQRIQGYIDCLNEEIELEAIDKEIAALEARYGTTPNAKTIVAMKEAEAGIGLKLTTLEEIKAECDALR